MKFRERYKSGDKVYLVVQGEGVYIPTIKEYDEEANRYRTDSYWYILKDSIVFRTEQELEEYKKTNPIHINRGCSEFGYTKRSDYGYGY